MATPTPPRSTWSVSPFGTDLVLLRIKQGGAPAVVAWLGSLPDVQGLVRAFERLGCVQADDGEHDGELPAESTYQTDPERSGLAFTDDDGRPLGRE